MNMFRTVLFFIGVFIFGCCDSIVATDNIAKQARNMRYDIINNSVFKRHGTYYIVTPEKDQTITIKANSMYHLINNSKDGANSSQPGPKLPGLLNNKCLSYVCGCLKKAYCSVFQQTDITHHLRTSIYYLASSDYDFDIDFGLGNDKVKIKLDPKTKKLVCKEDPNMTAEFFDGFDEKCRWFYILLKHKDYKQPIDSLESVKKYAKALEDKNEKLMDKKQRELNRVARKYYLGPWTVKRIDVNKLFHIINMGDN